MHSVTVSRGVFDRAASLLRRGTKPFVVVLTVAAAVAGSSAQAGSAAQWRALVLGLDHYPGSAAVEGAVANAADLGRVLRKLGTEDVTVLTGGQAAKDRVSRELNALGSRTRPGDTVLFSFGGRIERPGPDAPPGRDRERFKLALSAATGSIGKDEEALAPEELREFVHRVEERGGRAILAVDASFGPQPVGASGRSGTLPGGDPSRGIRSVRDAFGLGPDDLRRSIVLAASDPWSASAAVPIPGLPGPRRALTYSLARALEGNADLDADGQISAAEMLAYVSRLVYQLTDQRQKAAAALPAELEGLKEASRRRVRGIAVTAADTLGDMPDESLQSGADPPLVPAARADPTSAAPAESPVRLAVAAGDRDQVSKMPDAGTQFVVVDQTEEPELIWNATEHDVLTADGDLVAQNLDPAELGGVVARTGALKKLKRLVIAGPQQIMVLPNDDVRKRGDEVKVRISNAAGRALVLFNIRGDGVVQFLYPQANDPPILTDPDFTLDFKVNDPLGTDQVVAVTGPGRMDDLERGLAAINNRKSPIAAAELVHQTMRPGYLVGSVGVFSGAP